MSSRKKEKTASKLDHKQEVFYPLDYSFKTLSIFEDIVMEKPRSREHQAVLDLSEEVVGDSNTSLHLEKSNSTALKVNNNILNSWDGFWMSLEKLFVEPALQLQWIDFSFNDLKTIDEALLNLPNLRMLYFHGNNITSLSQVNKLSGLPMLRTLTLHGNPIEVVAGYKQHVLSTLPHLHTLDFSGITKSDRATADTWSKLNVTRVKVKKKSDD